MILGLFNKPRLVLRAEKGVEKHCITSIFIVPHRDLAFQLYRWLDQITKRLPKTRIASIAYVLVRGTGIPMDRQIKRLEQNPPHILICTPQALMDIYKIDRRALGLATLTTIVADEVDYLIKTPARKDPNKSYRLAHEKAKQKVVRHPGLTREFLDFVYSRRKEWNERRYSSQGSGEERRWKNTPQLILTSATLRVNLKNYLFEESGWLNKDNLVKIFRDNLRKKSDAKKVQQPLAGRSEPQGSVLHSVLVVSEGETKNVVGARAVPALKWIEEKEAVEAEVDERYDESK